MLPEGKIAVSTIKSGHSLSLDGHTSTIANIVAPRSALLTRALSTPKIPVDTSYESVQENINRKILHSQVFSSNPNIFKRLAPENSCSNYIEQKHLIRDLLPTMHPISDPRDISPPKFGYNFPRIPRENSELISSQQDFLQPRTLVESRRTGYSRGHIRSILELDTFGPQHSERVNEERLAGTLPMSPNVDRNHSPNSSGRLNGTGRSSSPGLGGTMNKSQSLPGLNGTMWDKTTYSESKGQDFEHPLIKTTTESYARGHDPRGSSLKYAVERKKKMEDKNKLKETQLKLQLDKKRQEDEAKEYQEYISIFEKNLESIQSNF
mmetsp:Transcript_15662/g.16406  ORF Transcript_15662/g.16406 Transcript_15662/m.16406 type:complete len:322 (+) Transcript_15662:26-991(+)